MSLLARLAIVVAVTIFVSALFWLSPIGPGL